MEEWWGEDVGGLRVEGKGMAYGAKPINLEKGEMRVWGLKEIAKGRKTVDLEWSIFHVHCLA